MSSGLPRSSYDPRRIFLFNLPKLNLGGKGREIGTYLAGGLVRPIRRHSTSRRSDP
jgi:hypothetical protein